MFKAIGDFLFGKDAKIFNKKGSVQHDLGASKWTQWSDRFSTNPDYNWKKHKGREFKRK